jgi:hypothetical protein
LHHTLCIVGQSRRELAMKPKISIIGVHPVCLTKTTLIANAVVEIGEGKFNLKDVTDDLSDREFAERFANLCLIEICVDHPDSRFDVGKLQQSTPGLPPDFWQVAYDEKYLTEDGTKKGEKPDGSSNLRLGFFLHSVDFERPLITPYGKLNLPAPTRMPQRLVQLFRYIPP